MSNRSGPRSDVDVKVKIVEVAERLFGELGTDAVSLRAVAREAGVSSAGLSYHYPTRASLVSAVVRRRACLLGPQVHARLAALLAASDPPAARDIVLAILAPLVDLLDDDPVGGLHWLKLFVQQGLAEEQLWHTEVAAVTGLPELFERTAARALPDIESPRTRARLSIAIFSMLTTLSGADQRGYGALDATGLDPMFVDELAIFTAAGLALG